MKNLSLALLAAASLSPLAAVEKGSTIGVVDFGKCITSSKFGKTEAEAFESIRNQMQSAISDLDKQLNETANQLQNPDLLDSLSPEGEQELRVKFQTLSEELQRYQSQYYQVMQQANMRLLQALSAEINKASEVIAKNEKLTLVINKEAAFHYALNLDITESVIAEMDKKFDKAAKEKASQVAAKPVDAGAASK